MTDTKIITPNYEWYTYDAEVFTYDFIVVFKNKLTGEYAVFHNDNEGVRDFISEHSIYCGFNTKHYDQYIIKAICAGFTPEEVKQVNDWIIGGKSREVLYAKYCSSEFFIQRCSVEKHR